MSQPSCTDLRFDLGAYVVGSLEPADRASVEAHLERCPSCRDEVAEIAGLPGLLAHLTPEEAERGLPEPPPHLLADLLDQLASERAGITRRRRLLTAAAALVLVAGGGTAAALTAGGRTAAHVTTLSAADPRTHVAATVWLRPKDWGTEVTVALSGVPADARCRLVGIGRDGHQEQAGSWEASYQGTASVTGAVSIPLAQLTRFDVVTFGGQRLVSVPISAAGSAAGNATGAAGATSWQ